MQPLAPLPIPAISLQPLPLGWRDGPTATAHRGSTALNTGWLLDQLGSTVWVSLPVPPRRHHMLRTLLAIALASSAWADTICSLEPTLWGLCDGTFHGKSV